MFNLSKGPGPISSFISAIAATLFLSIFFLVGSTLALYGYVKYKDAGVYSQTPVISVADIKEGEIVKFVLKSQSINSHEASFSKLPCVFYQTQYISFYEDSDGDLSSTIDELKKAPDQLTLESKDKNYQISLIKPPAELYFKNTFTYLKNLQTNVYEPTAKSDFGSGDYIIKENVISPDEDVLVFGKISKIIPTSVDGLTSLEFQNIDLSDPFTNVVLFYTGLVESILSNELTSYIVSTKSDKDLNIELKSMEKTTGLIYFGLAFCIIPAIILIGVWFTFIKSIFTRL